MDNMAKLYLAFGLSKALMFAANALMAVLAVVWFVPVLGQDGISIQNILSSVVTAAVAILFASKAVIGWSARHPWGITWAMQIFWIIDTIVLFTFGERWPWAVVISSCVMLVPTLVFFSARNVMLNRELAGDDLSNFNNKVGAIGTISGMCGSALGMVVEPTLFNIGVVSTIALVLNAGLNWWQIYLLSVMAPPEQPQQE